MNMPPFERFGIEPSRTLTTKERGRVRARLLLASMRGRNLPDPMLDEVRWSDDYEYVYVQKTSGLIELGLRCPVAADENWAIFDRSSPAARSLLGAIAAVLSDSPYASLM